MDTVNFLGISIVGQSNQVVSISLFAIKIRVFGSGSRIFSPFGSEFGSRNTFPGSETPDENGQSFELGRLFNFYFSFISNQVLQFIFDGFGEKKVDGRFL